MSKESGLMEVFISRPNWLPEELKDALGKFDDTLPDLMMYGNTIGISQPCLQTPFDDIVELMTRCECVIIFALPQIYITAGSIKESKVNNVVLPTEWNQIETAIALSLKKPTLVLLHKDVQARGLLERGAANVFIHTVDTSKSDWIDSVKPILEHLKEKAYRAKK
ncbi:hypothetical protein [Klebsiella variicola]|uniref:hypothetical protein n=1 Tax=Klebsiella variicola TaxID=244366 RepID=UPI001888B3FC|nr:hypothetical protein [Klebsiella variicola]